MDGGLDANISTCALEEATTICPAHARVLHADMMAEKLWDLCTAVVSEEALRNLRAHVHVTGAIHLVLASAEPSDPRSVRPSE